MGKALMISGLLLVGLGLLVWLGERWQIRLGQLPGDFVWRGKNTTVYFPLLSCLILSLLGTILMGIFGRK